MTRYGFVASGGGYRSFYSAGVLVWLKSADVPVVHVTSTSSGNNIVLDYLLWDRRTEDLPPVLTRTMRLSLNDIVQVFSNFLGLRPSLLPTGSHLFTVDKSSCRKSLLLDEPARRTLLTANLKETRWDILATNLARRQGELFRVNDILGEINDRTLDRFMDVFLAGITTIPYFKAARLGKEKDFYIEGGYVDNTPMRALFENPEVDEIIAIDFTDYDYQKELEKIYDSSTFTLPFNSIDMFLLVSDLQLTLPNAKIFSQAALMNAMLEKMGVDQVALGDRTFYRKPLHILRPRNLESMTISLKDSTIQKKYFQLGQVEARDQLTLAKDRA
ncbi:MAG: patatin-like phospholipase family protein [Rhodospirillales bacterium]|nr:MAG: patatin-like phospholipase family protein [Rhodospirillales bacterium]